MKSAPFAPEDKAIKRSSFTPLATLFVPLFLGACGLPLGVQIASFVADGISFVTTEKTISDHGLSMVTSQDCAVWRGFKGEEICRSEEHQTIIAQSDAADGKSAPDEAQPPPYDDEMMLSDDQLADMDVAAGGRGEAGAALAAGEAAGESPAAQPNRSSPLPLSSPSAGAPAPAKGGTFFVIASYRQVRHAHRLIHRQAGLGARILAGTAKGMSVYRVAVGPVAQAQRRRVRQRLVKAGFTDAWKLALKKPRIIVEVAALR